MKGKRIILGVTGSIAAYKAAVLVRLLVKSGAEVKVIMTKASKSFISELTLSTLSKHPVISEMFSAGNWNNHVELGLWADAMIVAPCTATTLAKCAQGIADNMLVATYLSAKCPIFFAPAMDLDMWKHGSTINNISALNSFGNEIIPVGHGELASGLVGDGRMAEPEAIVDYVNRRLRSDQGRFYGYKVLVNAGPTHEAIDPVRFIGNRSSGKMGISVAESFARQGAEVTLVLGPTHLRPVNNGIQLILVSSAEEMYRATSKAFDKSDIVVLAAAVADYTPATYSQQKMKKAEGDLHLQLSRTTDIAKQLGQQKKENQILVGFALETADEKSNAAGKLKKKNLDFIVLNSLNDKGAGFQVDTNKVSFLFADNKEVNFELKPKTEVADDIVDATFKILENK